MTHRLQDPLPRLGGGGIIRLRHWRHDVLEPYRDRLRPHQVYEPALRSSGRGTGALRLWTDYLFRASNWRRLDYSTWSGNEAMVRVGGKLGFTIEARFREARVVRGEVFDSVVLGVLRREWEGRPGEF